MFSWGSLFTLVSLVGSAISIIEFIRLRQRPGSRPKQFALICGGVFIALFIGSIIFAPILSQAGGTERVVNPTPTSSNSSPITSITSTPILTPTPSPTPAPKPGDVLYQADQSWSGWSGTKEWNVLNGMLTNDGTGYPGMPTILAPYQLQVSDYAVEANIQVVNWHRCCYSQFAIVVRASTNSYGSWQGYSVGEDLEDNVPSTANIAADAGHISPSLANAPFDPGTAWHTYRIEVKGNTIKLLIDEGVKFAITDNTYLSGGQVGFWSYEVQLNISNFKIIAI